MEITMKKKLIVLSLISLLMVLPLPAVNIGAQTPQKSCLSGTPYRGCSACGTARSIKAQQDNILKNRDHRAINVKALRVADIRDPLKNNSFYPNMEVELTGFVVHVNAGGLRETCNCQRPDLRDIQIEMVADWDEALDSTKYVILEISPRWEKKLGLGDEDFNSILQKFKNQTERRWVTFRGWMFFDSAHIDQSGSTNPGNPMNWRATPWEIHPVTYYEVLAGPPPR
jgi:hypothetical protein